MFLSYFQASLTDPVPANQSAILISATFLPDTLVLMDFLENPYSRYREGYDASDGRSLTGNIKIKGNDYTAKRHWQLAFLANAAQVDLFEQFLINQSATQVTINDKWGQGLADPKPALQSACWLDVDARYLTRYGSNWILQFSAREEI
jgi:hypothetical protein